MEQFVATLIAKLIEYGLPGMFAGFLIYQNLKLEASNRALAAEVKAALEKRIDEAMKTVITLGSNAAATEKMAQALAAMDERLHAANEEIARLCGRIEK